jgi:soluble lytic murein transglycosylase-like protein
MGVYAAIEENYYTKEQSVANRAKMIQIYQKYGESIKWVSHITKIDSTLLLAFIFIESAGNANARNGRAIGLMQISAGTASDALVKEYSNDRLTADEETIIKKYLGSVWTTAKAKIVKGKTTSLGTWVTESSLTNVGFNMTVGAIYLGQLLDEFTAANGEVRLDKVVAVYNMGRGGARNIIGFNGSTTELLAANIPNETKNYIKKLMGTNGVYHVTIS